MNLRAKLLGSWEPSEREQAATARFTAALAGAPPGAYFRTLHAAAAEASPYGYFNNLTLVGEIAKLEQRIADLEGRPDA